MASAQRRSNRYIRYGVGSALGDHLLQVTAGLPCLPLDSKRFLTDKFALMWIPRASTPSLCVVQDLTTQAYRHKQLKCPSLAVRFAGAAQAANWKAPFQSQGPRNCSDFAHTEHGRRGLSCCAGQQTRFFRYGASATFRRNDRHSASFLQPRHGTTILCVRKGDEVVSRAKVLPDTCALVSTSSLDNIPPNKGMPPRYRGG